MFEDLPVDNQQEDSDKRFVLVKTTVRNIPSFIVYFVVDGTVRFKAYQPLKANFENGPSMYTSLEEVIAANIEDVLFFN